MPAFERIDIKKRRTIPPAVKLILLVAVIIGFMMHNCWKKSQGRNLQISEIEITELTRVSADVAFVVSSRASIELKKSVLIEIYTKSGELIASKISRITIPPKTRKRYLKVLQKFNFPLDNPEDIDEISITWYK
ncbi:MAG: hypothetical protein KAW88_04665 [Candidatus Cloacimonetes bacterium]|nr:hypothetical protein [Candidatus Cloacimonadota bacterium]